MNGRLEIVWKQSQDQLHVRLWPFKFIDRKRGDIQVSERRIEGGISQLEQCMIDRFNEMADMSRCTGLKHEIVPVFYPFYVRRKLYVDWMKMMSPSETCWVIPRSGFRYFGRQDNESSLFLKEDKLSSCTMDAYKYYEHPGTDCPSYWQSESWQSSTCSFETGNYHNSDCVLYPWIVPFAFNDW